MRRGFAGFMAVMILLAVGAAAWFMLRGTEDVFLRLEAHRYTVVIDAGHGGADGGATALNGMLESGINLEIAKKTDLLMRFYGIKTVMVRTEDVSIHDGSAVTLSEMKRSDLSNRAKLVNATPDAVLVSIHQNSFTQSQYFGAQVFYADDDASKALAEIMQARMLSLDRENTRKTQAASADLYLLQNVSCPAVLVECGFLSNPKDSANLVTAPYQTKAAMAITAGVLAINS
ncbi:MAG: N-acetylmuramoyl-L-alanine amidase [Oscillospiraceae bacterium]|nr:N-acetylmuramoyl-L-alanine amidase [Oscillospiraceae bacterium]